MGGRKTILRALLAVVAIGGLVAAVWLAVLGHQQANRSEALRAKNEAAVAHNDKLSAQLRALTAAQKRTQTRIDRIDADSQAAGPRLDDVIHSWNDWLEASNALIDATNGFVDQAAPSGSAVRAGLAPRLRTISDREAAVRNAIVRFSAAASKARSDLAGAKP